MNSSLLCKWLWRWLNFPSLQWCKVIRERYFGEDGGSQRLLTVSSRMSRIWVGILEGKMEFMEAIRWELGAGDNIDFWKDTWLGDSSLAVRFPSIHRIALISGGVASEFWSRQGDNGYWEVLVRRNLNDSEMEDYLGLLELLQGVLVVPTGRDRVVWKPAPTDGFCVMSCYEWLSRSRLGAPQVARKHKEIWGCHVPLKVKTFMWLVYHERILTKAYLAKWSTNINLACGLCGETEETVEHLFLLCPIAKEAWRWLCLATGMDGNFASLEELWRSGRRLRVVGDRSVATKVSQSYIPAVLWSIWLTRNLVVFRGCYPYVENICEGAVRFIVEWGCSCAGAGGVVMRGGRFCVLG
ncbi:putative ribonuclease H protein [Acorus gramineus]|uniref:Ribonuclease H protein n=1 Tax=Acorus gramineus TaxID=55184 RepID=A0AAV9ADA3_ACOGR|nr:putative ribonuclease H protein [Acorus gramineus]